MSSLRLSVQIIDTEPISLNIYGRKIVTAVDQFLDKKYISTAIALFLQSKIRALIYDRK